MKEMEKNMKKLSQSNSGFVSTYFLSILLYVGSIIFLISIMDQKMIQTIMNMKLANIYLQQEIEVINDLKQRTIIEEESNLLLNTCSYSYIKEDPYVYVDIHSEYEEQLVITYDFEENIILSYTSQRDIID